MLRIDALGQWLLMQIETPLTYAAAPAPPLSQWVLGTATYDGATMRVYLNGVEGGSQSLVTTITASDHPLYIGAISSPTCSFHGMMDDIRIYNRALSANEVMQLYRETRRRDNPLLNRLEIPHTRLAAKASPYYYQQLLAG